MAFIVEAQRRILKVTDLKIPGNWRMCYDYVALLQQMPWSAQKKITKCQLDSSLGRVCAITQLVSKHLGGVDELDPVCSIWRVHVMGSRRCQS